MLAKAPADNAAAAAAREHVDEVCRVVTSAVGAPPPGVVDGLVAQAGSTAYLDAVHGLGGDERRGVVEWLGGSLERAWSEVGALLPGVARLPRTPIA
jgi:hypothetical protein